MEADRGFIITFDDDATGPKRAKPQLGAKRLQSPTKKTSTYTMASSEMAPVNNHRQTPVSQPPAHSATYGRAESRVNILSLTLLQFIGFKRPFCRLVFFCRKETHADRCRHWPAKIVMTIRHLPVIHGILVSVTTAKRSWSYLTWLLHHLEATEATTHKMKSTVHLQPVSSLEMNLSILIRYFYCLLSLFFFYYFILLNNFLTTD